MSAAIDFDLAPNSLEPIYRQIVEQVRRMVAARQCQPGDELPSVRAVALQHAINPMTVSKAYSLLEAEGLLERRRGLGMVIARYKTRTTPADKASLLRPSLVAAAQVARQLGMDDAQAVAAFAAYLQDVPKKDIYESE